MKIAALRRCLSRGRRDGKDPAMRGSGERAFQAAGKIPKPPRSPEWPEQTGRVRVQERRVRR